MGTRLITKTVLSTLLIAVGLPVVAATPAFANVCSPNSLEDLYITSQATGGYITHVKSISLAPGSSYSHSTTLSKSASLTAGITQSTSVSVSANSVISKASATAKVDLNASGTQTMLTSFTTRSAWRTRRRRPRSEPGLCTTGSSRCRVATSR